MAPLNLNKLIHNIADLNRLIVTCNTIKSNFSYFTKLTFKDLKIIAKNIQGSKFNFISNRLVNIFKLASTNLRFNRIISIRGKVVQKNIITILNEIYEPLFLEFSHGYQNYKNFLSAYEHIDQTFRGCE